MIESILHNITNMTLLFRSDKWDTLKGKKGADIFEKSMRDDTFVGKCKSFNQLITPIAMAIAFVGSGHAKIGCVVPLLSALGACVQRWANDSLNPFSLETRQH